MGCYDGLNQISTLVVPGLDQTDGPAFDTSGLVAEKTIQISGDYYGSYTIMGSHDGSLYVPILTFRAGSNVQSMAIVTRFIKIRRTATNITQVAASVAAELACNCSGTGSSGANQFISFAPIPPSANVGPMPAIDLFPLVPPNGLNAGFSVMLGGDFTGTIAFETSLDNSSFAPAGGFTLGPKADGSTTQNLSPIFIPTLARYVRPNIKPGTQINSNILVTIGGQQNCDCLGTSTVQANWPFANVRWYAIDGVNGNDNYVGYSDISSVEAGKVAKKTIAGLGAIFPRQGAGRKAVIKVAAGTYTDSIDVLFGGVTGYAPNFPIWLPTTTNPTAGCIAFDNSLADKTTAGFVTLPGTSAAGYNPVTPFDPRIIKCVAVGGGTPNFPAETLGPLPMGARIRFAVDTTTVGLRNAAAPIIGLPASDTVSVPNNVDIPNGGGLPTTPTSETDVFFIEMPGVIITAPSHLDVLSMGGGTPQTGAPAQIIGTQFSASLRIGADIRLTGCWANLLNITAKTDGALLYYDETSTQRLVNSALRTTGFLSGGDLNAGLNWNDLTNITVATGGVSFGELLSLNFGNGSFVTGGGLSLYSLNCDVTTDPSVVQPNNIIGAKTFNQANAVRIFGSSVGPDGGAAGVNIISSSFTFGRMIVQNQGANPALKVFGVSRFCITNQMSGSSGNSDVGMDLIHSVNSFILIPSLPTVTGTVGDIRLADGTVISWATAMAGVVDVAGNVLCSLTTWPLHFTPVAPASVVVAITNAPVGSLSVPARYVKLPDGQGGFYTFVSLT